MGFMDKMKEQAAVVTAAAKDAAQKGQAKVDAVQAKRAADGVLRKLGLAVYLQRTDRGGDATEAVVEDSISSLKEYEAEYGEITESEESDED